jgi:hypothetical protein
LSLGWLGIIFVFCFCSASVSAQIQPGQNAVTEPAATAATPPQQMNPDNYEPITTQGRLKWWLKANFGLTSLFDGMVVAGYQTGLKHPPQWGSGWDGFGRRYALRMSGIGLSTAMEGSLGAAWGEDPRYFRAGQGSFASRIGHVVSGAFMDRYRNGSYGPAAARFIAIPTSNVINNTWRPAGENSGANIRMRIGLGFAGKLGSNAFHEFWPDLHDHLFHRL